MKEFKLIVIGIAIGLSLGFFIGRSFIETEETTEYVKGKTVVGSVYIPDPVIKIDFDTTLPIIPNIPTYVFNDITKTVIKDSTVYQVVDSLALLKSYLEYKTYDFILFNNEDGKLSLKQAVQFNRLLSTDYEFTPNVLVKTKTIVDKWIPYIGVKYNTLNFVGVKAGIFYHNLGIDYSFNKNLGKFVEDINSYHEFGFNIKF